MSKAKLNFGNTKLNKSACHSFKYPISLDNVDI